MLVFGSFDNRWRLEKVLQLWSPSIPWHWWTEEIGFGWWSLYVGGGRGQLEYSTKARDWIHISRSPRIIESIFFTESSPEHRQLLKSCGLPKRSMIPLRLPIVWRSTLAEWIFEEFPHSLQMDQDYVFRRICFLTAPHIFLYPALSVQWNNHSNIIILIYINIYCTIFFMKLPQNV